MKRCIRYLLLLCPLMLGNVSADEASVEKTLLERVSDINMRSFEYIPDYWSSNSYVEFMKLYKPHRFNPKARDKRFDTYEMFKEIEKQQMLRMPIMPNDEGMWMDLELFAGKKVGAPFIAQAIDRTHTDYGKVKLMWMLAQPSDNHALLQERQAAIKEFIHQPDLHKQMSTALTAMHKTEAIFTSFWGQDLLKNNLDRCKSSIGFLNRQPSILGFNMAYTHTRNLTGLIIAACATGALTYYGASHLLEGSADADLTSMAKEYRGSGGLFLSFLWGQLEKIWPKNKWVQGGFSCAAAFTCGMSLKWVVDDLHGGYLFDMFLIEMMAHVAQTMNALRTIEGLVAQDNLLKNMPTLIPLQELFSSDDKDIVEFLSLMKSNTFKGEPSFFAHKGVPLRAFMLMHEIKDKLVLAINAAAELDVYTSFAKLNEEFTGHRVNWCFVDYKEAETPSIEIKNFWHPVVSADVVVPNSLTMGAAGNAPNFVITGPNAGGKSTILKSLALSILLAQTFGVAPAEQFSLTPFSSIATYLNITDDIGSGNSLYKAEVLRVIELMKRIDSLQPRQFSFALFDEVFNGTSPHEGAAAAYSIIDDLAKRTNSVNVVATHFELLTQLPTTNNRVANYKVSVNVESDGSIVYPFTLEPGISHQHVAIDILRNEGVSSHILEQAEELLKPKV